MRNRYKSCLCCIHYVEVYSALGRTAQWECACFRKYQFAVGNILVSPTFGDRRLNKVKQTKYCVV